MLFDAICAAICDTLLSDASEAIASLNRPRDRDWRVSTLRGDSGQARPLVTDSFEALCVF